MGLIDPHKTIQRCPVCGHDERANRNEKRFNCRDCGHQGHSDRGASVDVAVKGIEKHQNWNVPPLNSLPVPVVRKASFERRSPS